MRYLCGDSFSGISVDALVSFVFLEIVLTLRWKNSAKMKSRYRFCITLLANLVYYPKFNRKIAWLIWHDETFGIQWSQLVKMIGLICFGAGNRVIDWRWWRECDNGEARTRRLASHPCFKHISCWASVLGLLWTFVINKCVLRFEAPF